MNKIQLLDQATINKIAAGEVVERPKSVVKELVENSIDAKSSAITVEIKDGGSTYIRITDNGIGIPKAQIQTAFLRHSTSKIAKAEDLTFISSLGFRGEALASIAAVSQVEMMTKTSDELTGIRFVIEGGEVKSEEEIGCPEGTTIIIRNLFFNVPARKKFLKKSGTEAAYISDLMNKLALGNQSISFKYINNNKVQVHTSGNNNLKNCIYHVFGKSVTKSLLELTIQSEGFFAEGFIGKPELARGNRSYENYYINGRYIKSKVIENAIEDGYKDFIAQKQYPFVLLQIELDPSILDVNVHPTKMDVRFKDEKFIYDRIYEAVNQALKQQSLIPKVDWDAKKKATIKPTVVRETLKEAFEVDNPLKRKYEQAMKIVEANRAEQQITNKPILQKSNFKENVLNDIIPQKREPKDINVKADNKEEPREKVVPSKLETNRTENTEQVNMDLPPIEKDLSTFKIVGQLFKTYWVIEQDNKMYIMDQHAAHEKVLYEKIKNDFKANTPNTQMLMSPLVIELNPQEFELLKASQDVFGKMGYDFEQFGEQTYILRGVPYIFNHNLTKNVVLEMVDALSEHHTRPKEEFMFETIALMSCKAAVKGNDKLSLVEVQSLLDQLFKLENPFNCPHGRPTIISMTKYEIEKKFKRV